MNFTREPIIETIISPKDGYKLCVRSSRGSSAEEYFVDAIEVVSFGRAFFFRSLERPKSFLVPVTDYEVVEVKETRVALKNVTHERNIKIGGGREASVRTPKEIVEKVDEPASISEEEVKVASNEIVADADPRADKKRDRRRHRRRRLAEERREWVEKEKQDSTNNTLGAPEQAHQAVEEDLESQEIAKPASSSAMFGTLFPPPPTLISETISRYKEKEGLEGAFFSRQTPAVKSESIQEKNDDETSSIEQTDEFHDSEIPTEVPEVEVQE